MRSTTSAWWRCPTSIWTSSRTASTAREADSSGPPQRPDGHVPDPRRHGAPAGAHPGLHLPTRSGRPCPTARGATREHVMLNDMPQPRTMPGSSTREQAAKWDLAAAAAHRRQQRAGVRPRGQVHRQAAGRRRSSVLQRGGLEGLPGNCRARPEDAVHRLRRDGGRG